MAWTVNDIYQFYNRLANKNQAGGISSTDLFYFWNSEQKMYMSDLIGRWQAQNNGKEGANTGLIQNEVIMTKLTPFTLKTSLTISSNQATKPTGFIYTLALLINNTKVFQVDHDEWWAMLDDVIDPPSVSDNSYYYREYQDYYEFSPSGLTIAQLDYLKVPNDIVWGYTFDGNGRQVYDSATSTQPQWDDLSIVEITKRALKTLGIHFKDADFANFGQSNITTGN